MINVKRLAAIILAVVILPFSVLAEVAREDATVPAIDRDVVFTRGMELIERDIAVWVEGHEIRVKSSLVMKLITTDAYDRAQLSIAFCVEGEELLALWIEELPDGRGSVTLKNSRYRNTIDNSVQTIILQLLSSVGLGELPVESSLPQLMKAMQEYLDDWDKVQESCRTLEADSPEHVHYEFLGEGINKTKLFIREGLELETIMEYRSFVPKAPLFDLSDLIPEPLDMEANRYITKDGEEVIQSDGLNWLMHDPDFLELCGWLMPVLEEQGQESEKEEQQEFVPPQYSEETIRRYTEQAEAGDPYSMYAVAFIYYYGAGVEQDLDKALEWMYKGVEAGSPDAVEMLAYLYELGDGVPQDYAKAAEYYQQAVDMDNMYAMYNLGLLYIYGEGVEEDPEKGKELIIRSAQAGNEKAIEYVKENYPDETGITENAEEQQYDEEDFRLYMEQAEAGDAYGMYSVGYLYYLGQGTDWDMDKALEWFEKAGEAGSGDGFGMIGYLYDVGDGVPEDLAKAAEYYQKAAEMNCGFAMYNLALMYLHGEYVEKDPEKAKELMIHAAQIGYEDAIEYVKENYPEEYKEMEDTERQWYEKIWKEETEYRRIG